MGSSLSQLYFLIYKYKMSHSRKEDTISVIDYGKLSKEEKKTWIYIGNLLYKKRANGGSRRNKTKRRHPRKKSRRRS